jgi:hypothetical protein
MASTGNRCRRGGLRARVGEILSAPDPRGARGAAAAAPLGEPTAGSNPIRAAAPRRCGARRPSVAHERAIARGRSRSGATDVDSSGTLPLQLTVAGRPHRGGSREPRGTGKGVALRRYPIRRGRACAAGPAAGGSSPGVAPRRGSVCAAGSRGSQSGDALVGSDTCPPAAGGRRCDASVQARWQITCLDRSICATACTTISSSPPSTSQPRAGIAHRARRQPPAPSATRHPALLHAVPLGSPRRWPRRWPRRPLWSVLLGSNQPPSGRGSGLFTPSRSPTH